MPNEPTYQELKKKLNIIEDSINIIERSSMIIFLWENLKNWNVKFVTQNVENIFGYTANEFISRKVVYNELIVNEDVVNFDLISKNKNHNTDIYSERQYKIISKNGEVKWVKDNIYKRRDKNGNITHYEGIIVDITNIKKTEQELITAREKAEASEERYKVLSDASFEAIFISDNGFCIEQNNTASKMFGYSHTEAVDMFATDIFTKQSTEIVISNLFSGYNLPYDVIALRKDGTTFNAEIQGVTFFYRGKKLRITAIRDISNRKKIENELIIAKQKAEESDRLKTEFINNMSHEIRTPLNGILGFSNLLNNKNLSKEKKEHFTNIILSSGNQLLRIIDDILEISRLKTKQVKLEEKQLILNDLLIELFSSFVTKAKEKKIQLYFKKRLSDQDSTILADEYKLNKIIFTLLENAIKFTNEGFIEFGYYLKTDCEPTKLEIYIKDTGIGIKKENQKSIFERFSQEDKGLSRSSGGLGLGLSIAKENVELLCGSISIESEKNKGSTFFVTIPYKPVNQKINNVVNKNKKQNKNTILIVEDEPVNYLYIYTLLDNFELNLIILHAKNGIEAIEICRNKLEIDLILMDLKMPEMNGFDATKIIKKLRPNIPIVAQTAYSKNTDKQKALLAGCDDFITKPISESTLNKIIYKFLSIS